MAVGRRRTLASRTQAERGSASGLRDCSALFTADALSGQDPTRSIAWARTRGGLPDAEFRQGVTVDYQSHLRAFSAHAPALLRSFLFESSGADRPDEAGWQFARYKGELRTH